jgi:hypothetical protein
MKLSKLQIALGVCAAAALATSPSAHAQASLTSPSAHAQASLTTAGYTQNFSSMGTGTTLPSGWSGVSEAGNHYTFSPNVTNEYNDSIAPLNPNFTAGALSAATAEYLVPTQASATGDGTGIVNYQNTLATTQNGEGSESLGTDPSGNAATILELSLTNNTGSALNAINISYDIDRFTTISNTRNIPTGYANTGVEEFPGYHLFYSLNPTVASSWVDVTALDPTVNMGTVAGAVNVPNTVGITAVPTTMFSLGSSVASGSTFALAWFDDNGDSPSPDQEIGLNSIVVSAAPEPSSGWLGLVAVGAAFTLLRLRRRQA